MTDREQLMEIAMESPKVYAILMRIAEEYRRDEAAMRRQYPDLTEEDLNKLWRSTVERNFKQAGIE